MSVMILSRRTDGRSNQAVVVDYVRDQPPGRVFTYDDLAAVLSAGTARVFDRKDVQQVVGKAKAHLLRDHKRTLAVVPTVGYQLAHAKDHRGIAEDHTRRGHRQMKKALATVDNVRQEEMTEAELALHQAQCEINHRLYEEQRRILSKQSRQDTLIARLTSRVEQIEASHSMAS